MEQGAYRETSRICDPSHRHRQHRLVRGSGATCTRALHIVRSRGRWSHPWFCVWGSWSRCKEGRGCVCDATTELAPQASQPDGDGQMILISLSAHLHQTLPHQPIPIKLFPSTQQHQHGTPHYPSQSRWRLANHQYQWIFTIQDLSLSKSITRNNSYRQIYKDNLFATISCLLTQPICLYCSLIFKNK